MIDIIRGWVNVYRSLDGGPLCSRVQISREEADKRARSCAFSRIACIEIEMPEGYGLEGDDA